jgi:hypothetical protein
MKDPDTQPSALRLVAKNLGPLVLMLVLTFYVLAN